MGINPFDWVDNGLNAAGEAWDGVKDAFNNLVRTSGETIFSDTPGGRIVKETTDSTVGQATKATKVTTQAVTTALDFPLQALNNTMAFAYNSPSLSNSLVPFSAIKRPKGFKKAEASTLEQAVGIVRNTTLGEIIADALPGGDKVDTGTGFFVGGETAKEVNERKKELYPTLYGSTFTVGRAFAAELADNGVIEPGSVGYNVISGAIDFGWTVGADPGNLIPVGMVADIGKYSFPIASAARVGKRAKVTTTLSRRSKKILEKAAEEGKVIFNAAGLIDNGRLTVAPNNWEAFKLTPEGEKLLDNFVGPKSGTGAQIWRSSNGQIPPVTASKLARAETLDEVIQIMDDAVYGPDPLSHVRIIPGGIDPRPIVTQVGATIKGNVSRTRPFADTLPQSTDFPLNNPTLAVKNADSVMAVLNIDNAKRNGMLDELFEAFEGDDNGKIFEWLGKFEKEIVADTVRQFNYTEDEIKRIASWRSRYEERVRSFVTDKAGDSVPLEWIIGGPQGGYGPLLISQMLNINPVLIDPTDLRNIADNLGPIRSRIEAARRIVTETEIDPKTGEQLVVANKLNPLVNTPLRLQEGASDVVEYMQTRIWKPNILMRPRYLLKTLPDEILRVAATGIFDHAYQYVAALFTNPNAYDAMGRMITTTRKAAKIEANVNEANRVIRKLEALANSGQTTYKGKPIADLIAAKQDEVSSLSKVLDDFDQRIADEMPGMDDALLRGTPRKATDLMMNPAAISGMIKRGVLVQVERLVQPDLWSKAMAQRLAERASNGYYREIAKAIFEKRSIDEITNRFYRGDLKQFLDRYKSELGNLDPNYVWDFNGVRNFVQKNIDDLNIYTFNGDPQLLEAVMRGEFLGEGLSSEKGFQALTKRKDAFYEPNKLLKKYIKDTYSQDPRSPKKVNYFPSIFDNDRETADLIQRVNGFYDSILNLFWEGAYGTSSDKLARHPLWVQSKWERIIELIPAMTPTEAADMLAMAKKNKISKTIIDDIEELLPMASGEMTRKDVDLLSELFASRFTKDTLFDASRKTKFGANHRVLFPFFDAFVELTGSALKLATNPKVLHRSDQLITELRNNTLFGSDLDGDGKKESFLYRDPVSDQEMFAFAPPGGFLKEWKNKGLDFKFGNTLDSLSMITTPYPGLSPFVALPVVKMLPDTKEFDIFRNLIAPYGVPDLSDSSIAQYLVPGGADWIMRILGSNGIEIFSKTEEREKVMQATIRALQAISTVKDYDPVTPGIQGPTGYESIEEWQADGKELGLKIYGLTGLAAAFMPGAPIAQWSAKTKQGNVLISVLSQRWSQIDKRGDKLGLKYQDKLEQFVDEFGSENLVAFLQPITERSIAGSNSSKEYYDWYRANKSVVDKYSEVGGYFAPKSGELDPDVWNIQKIAGDVKYKDPEQFAKNVESAVANFLYNRKLQDYIDSIPPADRNTKKAENDIKKEKSRLASGLSAAYPNWDRASAATQAKANRKIQMLEVRKFVNEPSQQENPVVKAAKEYLDFRDQNVEYTIQNRSEINQENWKTMTANSAAIALRGALWQEGERLAEQYPQFVNLWQNILSREFISVDTEE